MKMTLALTALNKVDGKKNLCDDSEYLMGSFSSVTYFSVCLCYQCIGLYLTDFFVGLMNQGVFSYMGALFDLFTFSIRVSHFNIILNLGKQ